MIYTQSLLSVIDNTGARSALCIRVLKKAPLSRGVVGDIIICTIKHIIPGKRVKRGTIQKAVIVRDGKFRRRKDGTYTRFDKSACVLLRKNLPWGTNIIGPVSRELRKKGFMKVISKATIAI